LSDAYSHLIGKFHIFDLQTIYNENVTFRFYCKYTGFTQIHFLSNRKYVLSWYPTTLGMETQEHIVSISLFFTNLVSFDAR